MRSPPQQLGICVRRIVAIAVAGVLLGIGSAHAADGGGSDVGLLVGVNVVWDGRGGTGAIPDRELAERLARAVVDLDADVVRIGVSWHSIEPEPGVYRWEETDALVALLARDGIEPIACFCTTPEWASELTAEQRQVFVDRGWEGLVGVTPPARGSVDAFRRCAEACAARYRGRITRYEFWNEPEGMGMPIPVPGAEGEWEIRLGGDPEVYAFWLRNPAEALRSGNPDAVVAIGGLERWKENRFLEALLDLGAGEWVDALALHPYGRPDTEYEIDWAWVDDTARRLDDRGLDRVGIWITECGWHLSEAIDEERQAALTAAAIHGARERPRVRVMTFHTLNDWGGSLESAARMGFIDLAGRRRPAFDAFRDRGQGSTVNVPGPGDRTDARPLPGREHILGYIHETPDESADSARERHVRVAERRAGHPIIFHRGAQRRAPENTLECYSLAMDLGADGVEIDVHRTDDGILVLHHDDELGGVFDGEGKIREKTYCELLQSPLRDRKGPVDENTRIPTLAAFLDLARRRAILIHLDVKQAGIQDDIIEMIERADMWDHFVEVNGGNADRIRPDTWNEGKPGPHNSVRLIPYAQDVPVWPGPDEEVARELMRYIREKEAAGEEFMFFGGRQHQERLARILRPDALGADNPTPLPETVRQRWCAVNGAHDPRP